MDDVKVQSRVRELQEEQKVKSDITKEKLLGELGKHCVLVHSPSSQYMDRAQGVRESNGQGEVGYQEHIY